MVEEASVEDTVRELPDTPRYVPARDVGVEVDTATPLMVMVPEALMFAGAYKFPEESVCTFVQLKASASCDTIAMPKMMPIVKSVLCFMLVARRGAG